MLFSKVSYSQNAPSFDLKFINYLVNKGDYEDVLYLLDQERTGIHQSNDTVNYLRGWSLYSLKRLQLSSESFIKVKPDSEYYSKSHFFAAYNYTHLGSYNEALETLLNINTLSEKHVSIKNFELSGIYLLQGKYELFEDMFPKIDNTFFEISASYENLQKISADIKNHKTKSPLIAGFLSGIIPGSGKFYAGKRGEAISSFITTTGLGLVTWENVRKSGINNYKTLLFGTAFAFSYAANIYGAVITVNLLETEYRDNVKNSILFNLHIPLRNTFNK